MNILAVIPARGGSKGIPRKNVRLLNGKPLISYAINNAKNSTYNLDVCVSTDDVEIARVARNEHVQVVERSSNLGEDAVTLDPVIYDAYKKMEAETGKSYDLIITLQATSPLLTVQSLDKALDYYFQNSCDSLISVVNRPHLSWTEYEGQIVPNYKERLNRQYLPANYSETGAFLITNSQSMSPNSRLGQAIDVFEIPESEAIDIDTVQDWWVAENELSKKSILIFVEGYEKIGLGHVYRGLSLAYALINHNVRFVTTKRSDLAISLIEASFLPLTVIDNAQEIVDVIDDYQADIVINDILNTDLDFMRLFNDKNVRVINFEDLGPGAKLADAVINDLYAPKKMTNNSYWGSDYFILRDEFMTTEPKVFQDQVKEILVVFGGVDPSHLTEKLINTFGQLDHSQSLHFTVIVGPGNQAYDKLKQMANESDLAIDVFRDVKVMSQYMRQADIAVSSQGRTMLELASLGIPTVLMAQNKRELTHEFGYLTNGFINLGLGEQLDSHSIARTLNWLIMTPQVRKQMHTQMLSHDLRNGLNRVLKIILD
ncbi:cytidylyltransferase domain-containing protein [Aerococcus kribbianus]|uniref:Glycosyltransferase n=1 Tax=Aerococcus kribbianus TaxID=2999064 RepID=A0A9X3FMJ2_9LACT|nr:MULTISPECIES: glycosyltransferase [unclassified Aerococcus]MCZ0717297.1 glycosyltransferase [Aerococcus sp. YH-aer221]MCZ0725585.1 glycosyltransferase [Aerococcus sp. YH-aer222]